MVEQMSYSLWKKRHLITWTILKHGNVKEKNTCAPLTNTRFTYHKTQIIDLSTRSYLVELHIATHT